MSDTAIFWPVILLALFTMALYVPMSKARFRAVRSGSAKGSDFKLTRQEPDESAPWINSISNQFETPVLFYTAVLIAFMTGNAGLISVLFAWAFCLIKIAHVCVFVSSNNLRHRRPMFMAAYLILILFWLWIALSLVIG